MKFDRLPRFDSDFRTLKREHRLLFRDVVRDKFVPACDAFVKNPRTQWPASLRVKPMRHAQGIFEMTWSFASPDGRATFQFVTENDEIICRWRRIGDHSVFRQP